MDTLEKKIAVSIVLGTFCIAAVTSLKFYQYIENRRKNPLHDKALWGIKLSTLLVFNATMSIVLIAILVFVQVLYRKQKTIECKLDLLLNK